MLLAFMSVKAACSVFSHLVPILASLQRRGDVRVKLGFYPIGWSASFGLLVLKNLNYIRSRSPLTLILDPRP